jgi:hypothetical protein
MMRLNDDQTLILYCISIDSFLIASESKGEKSLSTVDHQLVAAVVVDVVVQA